MRRSRTDVSTPPSNAVVTVADLSDAPTDRKLSSLLFQTLGDLGRAEDAYFEVRGEYTADRRALPGYTPMPGARLIRAGQDWFVVHGEIRGKTLQQVTVWGSGKGPGRER